MIGTIILWVVVMWLVAGAWCCYKLNMNKAFKESAYHNMDKATLNKTEQKCAWFIASVLFILCGPLNIRSTIEHEGKSKEEIDKCWEGK